MRLNKAYRAIYVKHETGEVELIEVLEVNKLIPKYSARIDESRLPWTGYRDRGPNGP